MRINRREFVRVAGAFAATECATTAIARPAPEPSVPRRVERLTEWRFHLGHAGDQERDFGYGRNQRTFAKAGTVTADAALPGFDDAAWRSVRVPHDWAVELPFAPPANAASKETEDAVAAHGFKAIGRGFPANSVGWYRTPIAVSAADRVRSIWLEFDGVFRDCTVFVNGYIVATNASGYAPFSAAIGDFLDYDGGPNVVTLRVDASLGEGWFYEGAGVYRHVELVRANPVHVPQWGSFVRSEMTPGGATVRVALEVRNDGAAVQEVRVRQAIVSPDGGTRTVLPDRSATIAAGATVTIDAETALRAPRLWSIEAPQLHRLTSEIVVGGVIVDRYDTPFGIRTLRFDARQGFFLNGRPTKLLGTCNHQDHAGVGTGIPDALHAWRIAQLQAMGSNAWRTAHNPPATALLDLADRMGMLMIVEARRNSSDPEALGELDRIVRRDRNHPCIIAWSLGNEEPHQGTDRGARITRAMQTVARRLDPTRPTTFALDNSWDKGVGKVVDLVGFNYRTDQIEAFHAAHPDVPVYGSETGSTVSTRGAYANDAAAHVVRAYDTEHPWWASTAESWWTIAATRPYVAGGFVWTGFDYRGEPTPYPQFPSVSSLFGILDSCGFRKDNFFYYRAWWRPDAPMVHLLPHWTWPGREGQPIEIWVHGNCAEVELALNGRSLGRKPMPRNGHLAWSVPYAAGRIEARGFDGGRRTAHDLRETAGDPAMIELTSDRRLLAATGDDVAVVRAAILDARRRPVPDAAVPVRFEIMGDAEVIGVGNGDPTSLEADHGNERLSFHGLAQAIVRVGTGGGATAIRASSPGLASGIAHVYARRDNSQLRD